MKHVFFFFCILFVFGFLQFLQVRKIHHKFLHVIGILNIILIGYNSAVLVFV